MQRAIAVLDGFVLLEGYKYLNQGKFYDQWFRVTIYYNPETHRFLKSISEDWHSGSPPTRWRYGQL